MVKEPVLTPAKEVTENMYTVEDRGNCLLCHETGVGKLVRIPANYSEYTNDIHIICHEIED